MRPVSNYTSKAAYWSSMAAAAQIIEAERNKQGISGRMDVTELLDAELIEIHGHLKEAGVEPDDHFFPNEIDHGMHSFWSFYTKQQFSSTNRKPTKIEKK